MVWSGQLVALAVVAGLLVGAAIGVSIREVGRGLAVDIQRTRVEEEPGHGGGIDNSR